MTTQTKVRTLTAAQIKRVLSTGEEIEGVGGTRAMNLLIRGDVRNSRAMLREVIADRNLQSRFRHMAIYGIYQKGGRQLNADLVDAAQHADEMTAATVATTLGRTAPANQLGLVEELGTIAARHLKPRAEFAATLLSYRHGLSGNDVKAPDRRQMQDFGGGDAGEIKVTKATGAQAKRGLEALKASPVGLDLVVKNAQQIKCEPNTFLWLWTAEAANGELGRIGKAVAGVLLRKSRFDDGYALSSFGLTSPTRGGARFTMHRADTGKVMYAGPVTLDGVLELQARDHPGLAAVTFRAEVVEGSVAVDTALSAKVAREARIPKHA